MVDNREEKFIEDIEEYYLSVITRYLGADPQGLVQNLENHNRSWDQWYPKLKSKKNFFDAGAERVVYMLLNRGDILGEPSSNPLGSDNSFLKYDRHFEKHLATAKHKKQEISKNMINLDDEKVAKVANEEFVCINMDDDLLILGNILRLKEFYVSNKSDEVGILGDTVRVFTEKKGDSVKVTETKLFSCISSCYGKTPFERLKNNFNMEAWQGIYPKQTISKYIEEAAKIQLMHNQNIILFNCNFNIFYLYYILF